MNIKDMASIEKAMSKFFGVSSINEIEVLSHAAKKTVVSNDTTAAQLAWLYRARQLANEMIVGRYSKSSAQRAIELLKPLTSAAEEARKVPRVLAEAGIRFMLIESLSSAKIDGVCFWLDKASPVIALSMRFDRIDNFWLY